MNCLVCGAPRAGHPPCAICNDSSLVRLCKPCRADPANVDWNDRDMSTGSRDDVAADDYLPRAGTLQDAQDRKAIPLSGLRARIHALSSVGVPVIDEYRFGRFKRTRRNAPVTRRRWRAMTCREIAAKVGCSPSYVHKVLCEIMEGKVSEIRTQTRERLRDAKR